MNNKNFNDDNKIKKCLNSISFTVIGVFIIIFELVSLLMSILCIVMIDWNFLKNFIKILNIISLAIIIFVIIINTCIFIYIKNEKLNIVKNFGKRMCLSFLLIIIYFIIIIFNIYNSIYLSIKLHIADYPEYGGRKRDQNYIDNHPNEFGDVPLKQFIIAGFCPSLISVLNLICFILCVIFRKKMILINNKMLYEYENRNSELNYHRNKHRHNNIESRNMGIGSTRHFSTEIRNTNIDNKTNKNINTNPNIENKNNIRNMENNDFINVNINNKEENAGKQNIKKSVNKNLFDNNLNNKETWNDEPKIYTSKESKLNFKNKV